MERGGSSLNVKLKLELLQLSPKTSSYRKLARITYSSAFQVTNSYKHFPMPSIFNKHLTTIISDHAAPHVYSANGLNGWLYAEILHQKNMNIRPMKYTQNRKTLILIECSGQSKFCTRVYVTVL